jgi:hypothetical protein
LPSMLKVLPQRHEQNRTRKKRKKTQIKGQRERFKKMKDFWSALLFLALTQYRIIDTGPTTGSPGFYFLIYKIKRLCRAIFKWPFSSHHLKTMSIIA